MTPGPDKPRATIPSSLLAVNAVGLGGILGANARYAAGHWLAERTGPGFPWGTLTVNFAGCLALGWFLTLATERTRVRPALRLLVATGFLGAFTTFSAFSEETLSLLRDGHPARAALYVALSLALGLLATVAGAAVARCQ